MLSRVADSIYWMSRYVERAENVARFIDVNLNLILDLPGSAEQQWRPLVDITGDTEEFAERYGEATEDAVIRFLTFDTENPELDPVLPARGARERPSGPRDHLVGDVGAPQPVLPDARPPRPAPASRSATRTSSSRR